MVITSDILTETGRVYTFSELGDSKFARIPGSNTYVNKNGDSVYYDSDKGEYYKSSLTPRASLIAPGDSEYTVEGAKGMDDSNASKNILSTLDNKYEFGSTQSMDPYTALIHQNNLFTVKEMDLYNKTYRFGYFNKESLTHAKEFLFFTKPDLHILGNPTTSGSGDPAYSDDIDYNQINPELANIPFWRGLTARNLNTIRLLQSSIDKNRGLKDKFNHLLQNHCISNLEVPTLSAEMTETATNEYGVGFSYRGSSEASDDKPSFSLEFRDTKYLDIYYYFKAYEEYETAKHHGTVRPFKHYIEKRILHDQIAIYKFLVDEDMETILYYGKMYGVVPKSLPRDVFSNTTFENGLSYSIDFEAAFYEDMNPEIISDFNALSDPYYNTLPHRIDVYNNNLDAPDNRPAKAAHVEIINNTTGNAADDAFLKRTPGGCVLKLRWRGDDTI